MDKTKKCTKCGREIIGKGTPELDDHGNKIPNTNLCFMCIVSVDDEDNESI